MMPMRSHSWSASSMLWVVKTTVWPLSWRLSTISQRPIRLCGIEAGGGLVEKQDGGPVEHRAGDHQPLRQASRERHHRRLGSLAQVEHHQQLVGGGSRGGGAHTEEPAVEIEVLPHGQRPIEGVCLRHHPDQLLCDRRLLDHVDATHKRLARGRDHPGREHAGRGGLARPVRPEQSEDLARGTPSDSAGRPPPRRPCRSWSDQPFE